MAGWNAGPEPQASGLGARRFLLAIARYKWMVLALAGVGAAGGYVASKLVKPEYQATGTLWIGADDKAALARGPLQPAELLQAQGWIELLRSFTVLDYVIQEQQMFLKTRSEADRPLFAEMRVEERFRPGGYKLAVDAQGRSYQLSSAEGVPVATGPVGSPVGREVGIIWTPTQLPAGRTLEFELRVPRDVALELTKDLRTMMSQDGRFIGLAYKNTDPELAAAVVNSVSDRVVVVAAELKRLKLDELTAVLEEQLRQAEGNLRQSELALEGFRVQTITLPTENSMPVAPGLQMTLSPALSNYFSMKIESDQLRQSRESIERVLSQRADSSTMVDALAMVPAVNEAPEFKAALNEVVERRAMLRQARQRYTDDHPEVQRLAASLADMEQRKVPEIARGVAANLASRERESDGQIGMAGDELQRIPARMIDESRHRRQVAIDEQLFAGLRQRYEDARLSALSSIPDLRVLDRARVPHTPSNDQRLVLVLVSILIGVGAGVAGAVVLERLDPRVYHAEQVTRQMGLNILGAVPHVRISAGLPDAQTAAAVAEAFREVRLGLLFSHPQGEAAPFQVTLTSPGTGDGKSFICLNLSLAFAELGKRTLVIDGDIRRGTLHRMFGLDRTPGLTDYLSGNATREQLVQGTRFPNLDMIGSGTRMQLGPELLGSERMKALVKHLRDQYDVILIDSAPMGAGSDAYTLATLTGNLALVVRSGRTNRGVTEAKLSLIDRLPVRVLGVVLNDVPASRLYNNDYPYLQGYEALDEVVEEDGRAVVVS
jgi:polysaccharide biosynthesis transport protein